MPDPVKVHSSHNAALSLWQSALHTVLVDKVSPNGHQGIGATASDPRMLAAAQVAKHFDATGNFQIPPSAVSAASPTNGAPLASGGGTAAATARSPTPAVAPLECAKLAAQIAFYSATDPGKVQALKDELADSTCDPSWSECLAVYEKFRLSGQDQTYIKYTDINQFVVENCFDDVATIAIIGDWGTGMNDALVLLQQIGANFQKLDALIHLGDIYYSGLPDECSNHFTKLINQVWPAEGGKPVPLIFTLDGNHDRYAGSQGGYYGLIQNLNKKVGKPQPNSYFALRNNFWQFVAMDTGYYDANPYNVNSNVTKLWPEEVEWHVDKIKNSGLTVDKSKNPDGVRGTVLLSHHQLFSLAGIGKNDNSCPLAVNPNLASAFAPVFNLVDFWLWGHEHSLCIFQPYSNGPGRPLPKGRCVGASAVPIYLSEAAAAPKNLVLPQGETGPPKIIDGTALGNNGTVFNYCYAILTLNGPTLSIDYYQLDSTDSKPGSPPKLGGPLYSEKVDRPLATAG